MPDRRPARARAHTPRSPPVRARLAAQIFNKGALGVFPFPLQLTSLQYFVSAAAVWVLARAAVLESDPLRWQTVRKFWFVSAVFTLAIYSNTKVLHHASVETVIVFRSATPRAVPTTVACPSASSSSSGAVQPCLRQCHSAAAPGRHFSR